MGNVVVKMNSAGVRAIENGPEVRADLMRRCEAIRQATGDPESHSARVDQGASRLLGIVTADTREAEIEEATNRSLARALDAGR
jgi:hypothetical protein